ncbi:MAG: adenylate/guanylate cyclase domain-containing protein, partial [Pseudomonadota bacterium]
ATGPSVGLACRCEGMTRTLDTPIVAIDAFADLCPTPRIDLGTHAMCGFAAPVAPFSYPSE